MLWLLQWIRDNSLCLVFLLLFLLSLGGQSVSGYFSYNQQLSAHEKPDISYEHYLGTGNFLDAIFVNWQAAMLQLWCLILFSGTLYQRGASHSRKPQDSQRKGKKERGSWIYRNSFSLAFLTLFCLSFVAHIIFGAWAYNESRALYGNSPVSTISYLASGNFWFKAVQAWEAEFAAIFLFIVLSVFLRQRGSAESKPTESSDEQTGEPNE